jgi:hypothetical protein
MKKQITYLMLVAIMAFQFSASGQTLSENLKILEPLLNEKWVGDMKSPDGSQTFKVSLSYEPIWGGEVIKYTRSNPDRNTYQEGHFYWDINEKNIIFMSVSNKGGALKADVTIEEGKITLRGSATINNKSFDYKNTFEFTSDGKMIDRWFQNASGTWQSGHVIEFIKSK